MGSMNTLEAQLERLKPTAQPAVSVPPAKAKRAGKAKAVAPATERQAKARAAEKVHIGAWLPRDFKRGLKMVQAQTDEDVQAILARLLNTEFQKRKIPVVQT
jgi:hypothetical protein